MTPEEHAARIGELAAELSMAVRNAANLGLLVTAKVDYVGLAGTGRRIPRVNVKIV